MKQLIPSNNSRIHERLSPSIFDLFAKKAVKKLSDMYDFLKENLCTDYKNWLNDYKSYTDIHNLPVKYRHPGSASV